MQSIYLYSRPAFVPISPWQHTYLVKREEPVGNDLQSVAWHNDGEYISGSTDFPIGFPLKVYSGLTAFYAQETFTDPAEIDPNNTNGRKMIDITDFSGLTGTGGILSDLRCPYL